MKAVICTKYGSPEVLHVVEIEKPQPKGNEILVRVFASSATTAEAMMRKGIPRYARLFLGLTKPKVPATGTAFAGKIEAIGKHVTYFNRGDTVFGETGLGFGANAEYVCIKEVGLIINKPNNISFEEAAPICDGALTSMNFLKEIAKIKPKQKVLINGASGSLGTAAIQLAKHFGAEVTGVCSSANVDLVKSLGADNVIDYTKEDFTKNKDAYDIIYDTIGKSSYYKSQNALKRTGIYLSPVLSIKLLFHMLFTSLFKSKKAIFSATGLLPVKELKPMLLKLTKLFEKGDLATVIDKTYPLEQIIEAHRYIDSRRKKGNVVLVSD